MKKLKEYFLYLFFLNFNIIETGTYKINLPAGQYAVCCYRAQGGATLYNTKTGATGGKGSCVKWVMIVTGTDTDAKFNALVGGKGIQGSHGPNEGGKEGKALVGLWTEAIMMSQEAMVVQLISELIIQVLLIVSW